METLPAGALVSWSDFTVLAVLLAIMVGAGWVFRKSQTTSEEFFLVGRRIPAWAACLSFVATEVSAVTIISVPATAFKENWEYLQFFVGSAGARLVIAFLFIPAFYKFQCTTIYQYLGRRFGSATQVTASFFFLVTRLMGSGVRLMAAAFALSILLGWDIRQVIVLLIAVGMAAMFLGGMRAVVWTNVLQALVFIGGGLATLVFLGQAIPGGWSAALAAASEAGKIALIDRGPALGEAGFLRQMLENPNIWWLAILNGFFGSMAAFGTDQDLMQRLLTVETRRDSQRTMIWTIGLSLSVVTIFLTVGTGLFAYYHLQPALALPAKLDGIFPHFIGHEMPPLLKGWLLSAIVLAAIDSPLASLATSFVTDVGRPLLEKPAGSWPDKKVLRLSRGGVLVFGLILALVAYGFSKFEDILWLAFKIGGVTFGSLLGVFLLGLLTRRVADRTNLIAMGASAAVNAALLVLAEKKIIPFGWSWLVILGTFLTFFIGAALARRNNQPE